MDDKSQLVLDKSQFFLFFWDLSDTIWDFYVRSWDLSDISWDLSDRSWDLSDLCVGQIQKKKKNMGFVLHDLGFVSQVTRTNPNSCRTNPKKKKYLGFVLHALGFVLHFLVHFVLQIPNVFDISHFWAYFKVTSSSWFFEETK